MIRKVEIRGFKCFDHLVVPELARVNIISGANNVGKTSLLEALFLFHDRNTPNMFLGHFARRGIGSVRVSPESLWAPYFHNLDINRQIEICVVGNKGEEQATYKFQPNFIPPRGNGSFSKDTEEHIETETGSHGSLGGMEITYIDPSGNKQSAVDYMEGNQARIYTTGVSKATSTVSVVTGQFPNSDEESKRLSRSKEQKRGKLIEHILQIIEPSICDLQVNTSAIKPYIDCDIGLPRLVPIGWAGDGLRRLLSIALAMSEVGEGGLVLVDEIENGFHYSVQEDIWRAIAEAAETLNCQIVATTHSHEFLRSAFSAFDNELFKPDYRYIRLEKIGDEIKAKTFTHEMLGAALEAHLEVR